MRIGWAAKGLFIQLTPREGEGEYRLSLRVLRDGGSSFGEMKGYLNNRPLNESRYLTFPFSRLKGAIQADGLRALFPNDRAGSGGWLHRITYEWETPRLLAEAFFKEAITEVDLLDWYHGMGWRFPAQQQELTSSFRLPRGESVLLPWKWVRDDLGLRPVALLPPLKIIKDEHGQRFAGYRLQPGETLYTNVVVRFTDMQGHEQVHRAVGDLLALNGLDDPRAISQGRSIKIPLQWVRSEFKHPVPGVHEYPEWKSREDYMRHDIGSEEGCPYFPQAEHVQHCTVKDQVQSLRVPSTHAS